MLLKFKSLWQIHNKGACPKPIFGSVMNNCSSAGRRPPRHLPAANVTQPKPFPFSSHVIFIHFNVKYKHSTSISRLTSSVVPLPGISRATLGDINLVESESPHSVLSPEQQWVNTIAISCGPRSSRSRTSSTSRRQFCSSVSWGLSRRERRPLPDTPWGVCTSLIH